MKKLIFPALTFVLATFGCAQPVNKQPANRQINLVKDQNIGDGIQTVAKQLKLQLVVDTSAHYPNGGKRIVVEYPKDAFVKTADEVALGAAKVGDRTLDVSAQVSSGHQDVNGATEISATDTSIIITRKIPDYMTTVYIFTKNKAVRYEVDTAGKRSENVQVLP